MFYADSLAQLPRIDIEQLLRKVGGDNRAVSKLATGQRLDGLLSFIYVGILDKNLANTGVDTGAGGTRDLDLLDLAILGALFLYVFLDFCNRISTLKDL
jgi:hypothetical protein